MSAPLPFDIDKSSPVPVYYQLKEQLAIYIRNETYPVGSQLPPETAISEKLGISRGTVRQAISDLVSEGRLSRVRGRGTFVTELTGATHLAQRFTSFAEDMQELDIPYASRLISGKIQPAGGRLLKKLGLGQGSKVVYLERLGSIYDKPYVLAFSYLPLDLCPDLLEKDLTNQSLYQVLEDAYGLHLLRATRTLEAATADEYESRLLNVKIGTPVHFMQSLAYLDDGRVVEYSRLRFRGDMNRMTFEVRRKA